jgi:hypothetical protein
MSLNNALAGKINEDLTRFLHAEIAKYNINIDLLEMDDPYVFGFRLLDESETEEEIEDRHIHDEEYVRAWFALARPTFMMPNRRVSIYGWKVYAAFPDENGEPQNVEGTILETDCDNFKNDPLLILKNETKDGPTKDYDTLEILSTQVLSWFPKDIRSMFHVVKPEKLEQPPAIEEKPEDDEPIVS